MSAILDDIARAARGETEHDEVPTFAILPRHVQTKQSLENLIARLRADDAEPIVALLKN